MTVTFGFSGAAFTVAAIGLVVWALAILARSVPQILEALTGLVTSRHESPRPSLEAETVRTAWDRRVADRGRSEIEDIASRIGVAPAPEKAFGEALPLSGPTEVRWNATRNPPPEPAPTLETEAIIATTYLPGDRDEFGEAPIVLGEVVAPGSKLAAPPPGPPLESER